MPRQRWGEELKRRNALCPADAGFVVLIQFLHAIALHLPCPRIDKCLIPMVVSGGTSAKCCARLGESIKIG